MKKSNLNSNAFRPEPTHDEIAQAAFLAWEKDGRPPGRENIYWFNAEAQLRQLHRQPVQSAANATSVASKRRTPTAPARKTKPTVKLMKASGRQVSVKVPTVSRTAVKRRSA